MLRVEDLGLAIPCLAGLLKYACWAVRGGKNILMGGIRTVNQLLSFCNLTMADLGLAIPCLAGLLK